MQEPKPMKEIHNIRREIYEETKHMSKQGYLDFIRKNAVEVEKIRKKTKAPKSLEVFFANLNKRKKAG